MCANSSTVPCGEDSLYINQGRACCLYRYVFDWQSLVMYDTVTDIFRVTSIDNSVNYMEPTGLTTLENSTYGIAAPVRIFTVALAIPQPPRY